MSRFSIAGIQMHITMHNNIAEMRKRMEILFYLYPWVEMVVFSELSPHGPNKTAAQPIGGKIEKDLADLARRFDGVSEWVFDLDNTLYPRHCDLFAQIDWKMTDYVADLLDLLSSCHGRLGGGEHVRGSKRSA